MINPMGYYINKNSQGESLPVFNKALALVADGAKVINQPREWMPNLVCVIESSTHDAALYIDDERTFQMVLNSKRMGDQRETTWLVYEHAHKLSGA
jgi:hypothetical protein